jgi:Ras GTPase-activating-like protein IQGAP2/3
MDRSNSTSSTSSTGSVKRASSAGPFAYQTRLLERTSSRGSGASLSRNNSQSSGNILTNITGSSTPASTRRWAPSHRVGNSLDAVRGKWEERARADTLLENQMSTPTRESVTRTELPTFRPPYDASSINANSFTFDPRPPVPPPKDGTERFMTPTYLKRRTLPTPIIASPLSPNNTGLTVEANPSLSSLGTPTTQRIHLPTPKSITSPPSINSKHSSVFDFPPPPSELTRSPPSNTSLKQSSIFDFPPPPSEIARSSLSSTSFKHSSLSDYPPPLSDRPRSSPPSRYRRSNTIDTTTPSRNEILKASETLATNGSASRTPTTPTTPTHRRPTSLYGTPLSVPSSPDKSSYQAPSPISRVSANAPNVPTRSSNHHSPVSPSASPSVMSPTPYRSSYMANKKASSYGDNLVVGRKLGRHLPRIASGDGDNDREVARPIEEREPRFEKRERRIGAWENAEISPEKPSRPALVSPGAPGDNVAGKPSRIRLSRDKTPSAPSSPLSSTKFSRGGLWADTQRQHIQAYEYLCHVGEAQEWIELCLDRELGFGVVEMEAALRNGVVLAKLAQVFQGEAIVRRIYEVCNAERYLNGAPEG